jgi:dUTP pyrophosphatase
MAKLLYLARPIDYYASNANDAHNLMRKERDWVVFDPSYAFTVSDEVTPDHKIRFINKSAMSSASACLALLPTGAFTVGVPMEIEYFLTRGLPVSICGGEELSKSWSLAGIHRSEDLEECIAWLLGRAPENRDPHDRLCYFELVHPNAKLPTRAHDGDAAWDLYCVEDAKILPGQMLDVPLGIKVQPPSNVYTRLIGRSSLYRKYKLLAIEGTIDSGYRGELFAAVINMNNEPFHVKEGMRLCQLVPMPLITQWLEPAATDHLVPSARGDQGFGSTGQY